MERVGLRNSLVDLMKLGLLLLVLACCANTQQQQQRNIVKVGDKYYYEDEYLLYYYRYYYSVCYSRLKDLLNRSTTTQTTATVPSLTCPTTVVEATTTTTQTTQSTSTQSTPPVTTTTAATTTAAATTAAMTTTATTTAATANATTTSLSTTTASVPTTATPDVTVRIPLEFYPYHYALSLLPLINGEDPNAFTFNGTVKIFMECRQVTDRVHLHMKALVINNGSLDFGSVDGGVAPFVLDYTIDTKSELVIFSLSGNVVQGKQYYLEISYTGELNSVQKGFFYITYKDVIGSLVMDEYIALTNFQPTGARTTFPCFDEPGIKATFNVTLQRQTPMSRTLSNTPLISTVESDESFDDKYSETDKMSTYSLAFFFADRFGEKNMDTNGITYAKYYEQGVFPSGPFNPMFEVAMIEYFGTYLQVSIPIQQQDDVAIPGFQPNFVANMGLNMITEAAMVHNDDSSEQDKELISFTLSQGIAFQWFANTITPSWWGDLWLNEALPIYLSYLGVASYYPQWQAVDQFVINSLHRALFRDSLAWSHPLYVPYGSPEHISSSLKSWSRFKGASIMRMLNFILGDDTFRNGLKRYLMLEEVTSHNDLWAAMTNQSVADNAPVDVNRIMETWVYQKNYPVIHMNVTASGIKFTQQQFVLNRNANYAVDYPSPFGYKWDVPLTFTHSSAPDFNQTARDITWLSRTDDTYVVASADISTSSWIIGNVMQYGYYRVNYETSNWDALVNQLKTNHSVFPPVHRAQIISDLWNLAWAGLAPLEQATQLYHYFGNEREYIPLKVFFSEISYMDRMLNTHSSYRLLMGQPVTELGQLYTSFGMNNTAATHMESLTRALVAEQACKYGVRECTNEALRIFNEWIAASPLTLNTIDPSMRSVIYCTGVRYNIQNPSIWNVLYSVRSQLLDNEAETYRIRDALTCSNDAWILNRYLKASLDVTEFTLRDTVAVISGVASNPQGRCVAWDFLRTNYKVLAERYKEYPDLMGEIMYRVTQGFNSDINLKELIAFRDSLADLGPAPWAFEQVIANTKMNIKWMEENVPLLEQYFY